VAQSATHICPACGRTNRNGERAYSEFHRTKSAVRWISYPDAYRLATINLDQVLWIECHQGSYEPLALIETAQDIGQRQKNVTTVTSLAKRARVKAYLVLYSLSNLIDPLTNEPQIDHFCVRQLWAGNGPPKSDKFYRMTQKQYLEFLIRLRKQEQTAVLRELGRPDAPGHKRNHDIERLRRLQNHVPNHIDLFK
jgi:hypothetical protein